MTGLARTLSKLGYCSRSRATELIRAGRVTLHGKIIRDPEAPVSAGQNHIAVDGRMVVPSENLYLMLNKPRGVVTTASDEQGRPTVYDILTDSSVYRTQENSPTPWVAPIGRLDKASEGLLLLTNDSAWGARITAPATHLPRTYHVQIVIVARDEFLRALVRGVKTKSGEVLNAQHVRRLRAGQKNCWLEIVLDQGKNRQIRRMIEALGAEVLRLVRVAIGPLQLGQLAKAEYRSLTVDEKLALDRAMRNDDVRQEKKKENRKELRKRNRKEKKTI